jgi:hypothetical protein
MAAKPASSTHSRFVLEAVVKLALNAVKFPSIYGRFAAAVVKLVIDVADLGTYVVWFST